ncbi:MAG: nuclear transport factor 2 family protein [Desulfobulbaceae bacterium]|nr:nuclear transport factor 2 family protein [Desulfobulbaceae bacterium]
MNLPIPTPITGAEVSASPGSPLAALVAFYRAFNGRDLPAMTKSWADSPDIAMDNPLGGIKRGWPEIAAVYQRIFTGPAQVYVEFYDYTLHQHGEMFYAVGRERGSFVKDGLNLALAIRTSRIFRRIAGDWQQVHHHGSIEDPALLARYQQAVSG